MSDNPHKQPRALAPRKLEQTETLQSLNLWKGVFKNYFRRCQFYSYFLAPDVVWNNGVNRGFTANEPNGLKRNPATLASDLEGFLSCISSYLPFDYIFEKLNTETTNLESVWTVIYEIYDAEIVTSNYMDIAFMTRNDGETYRNYYNRLVGFTRQHLPKTTIRVEGLTSPATGENLTVALLDSIAIHWLLNIDRRLISIVKTEFASELKTKRLSEMIKTIATNIDDLLIRYEKKDQIASIQESKVTNPTPKVTSFEEDNNGEIDTIIRRIEKLEQRGSRNFNKSKFKKNKSWCKHCKFINSHLGSSLDINHPSHLCKKRNISINLIESLGDSNSDSSSDQDDIYTQGEKIYFMQNPCNSSLQNSSSHRLPKKMDNPVPAIMSAHSNVFYPCHYNKPENDAHDDISESVRQPGWMQNNILNNADDRYLNNRPGTLSDSIQSNNSFLAACLQKIKTSSFGWDKVHKSTSPRICCKLSSTSFPTLIDTGAEINVLDKDFAISLGIGINRTNEKAHAANRLPLDVYGQTMEPVSIECETNLGFVSIHLGLMLVISNLGVKCLIGEPGKALNNLICLPKQKIVLFANENPSCYAPYMTQEQLYTLARTAKATTLDPGEQILYELPNNLKHLSHVVITPRVQTLSWLRPAVVETHHGAVYLTNSSSERVNLSKALHLADIRNTTSMEFPTRQAPSLSKSHPDRFQFTQIAPLSEPPDKYLNQIQVDPDGILTTAEKQKFHDLHQRFAHLFTPQPGRYNGEFGHVDNKLQFSTPHPQIQKPTSQTIHHR